MQRADGFAFPRQSCLLRGASKAEVGHDLLVFRHDGVERERVEREWVQRYAKMPYVEQAAVVHDPELLGKVSVARHLRQEARAFIGVEVLKFSVQRCFNGLWRLRAMLVITSMLLTMFTTGVAGDDSILEFGCTLPSTRGSTGRRAPFTSKRSSPGPSGTTFPITHTTKKSTAAH